MKLKEYINIWVKVASPFSIIEKAKLENIKLKYIVSLYEALELYMFDFVVSHDVQQMYKEGIPIWLENEVLLALKNIPLEHLLLAVKKFIIRYLCKEEYNNKHPISSYLAREGLWTIQNYEKLLEGSFPGNVLLCHTLSLYKLLDKKLQEKNQPKQEAQKKTNKLQKNL